MRHKTDVILALLIPSLILLYLSVAPYTKIEESFTIQATHDLLQHGLPLTSSKEYLSAKYDHILYPELHPVPRTFVAPLVLAGASWPFAWLVDGVDKQILVRAVLGLYNAFSILAYRNAVSQAFGRGTANWYTVFQASQFHVMYYASRTLPNLIPFGLSTIALKLLLPPSQGQVSRISSTTIRRDRQALIVWTVLGIVFRSELAILLGAHTIWLFLCRRLSIKDIVVSGLSGLAIGLGLTVSLDSFFWQQFPSWPELTSFLFNVMEGKSVDWGTSPFHFYFSNALPKIMFNPMLLTICLPLAIFAPGLRRPSVDLLVPSLAYVLIYSFQPHKEWRFIVYVIPSLNTVAARGANWIWTRRAKSFANHWLSFGLVLSSLGCFAASMIFLIISSLNYPGAIAINQLHTLADGTKSTINVHMDVLGCQTGATLFLQIPETRNSSSSRKDTLWFYDKSDDKTGDGTILLAPEFWARFDYALAERPEKAIGAWKIVGCVNGYTGIGIVRHGEATNDEGQDFYGTTNVKQVGEGPWAGVGRRLWALWQTTGKFMRKHVTRGWWIDVKMKPMINILKRQSVLQSAK